MSTDPTPLPAPLQPEPDAFGVPDDVFGRQPEAFWGGLGRTVALAAVLEDQLIQLLMTLTGRPDDPKLAGLPGRTAVAQMRAMSLDAGSWHGFEAYLDRAGAALTWRHELAHSLWPAQDDPDSFFGHRRARNGARTWKSITTAEIRGAITTLVDLVREWPRWYGLAQARPPRD